MAEYTNARSYPVEINTGRMLAPGATSNLDAANAHNLALITVGDLILYDADTPPEDPDDLYRNVQRRVFLGPVDEPPNTMDRGGDVLIDDDGGIHQRDAAGQLTQRGAFLLSGARIVVSETQPVVASGDTIIWIEQAGDGAVLDVKSVTES